MERINGFPFYLLGNNLGVLIDHLNNRQQYTLKNLHLDSFYSIQSLEQFIQSSLILPLSKKAAQNIISTIKPIIDKNHIEAKGEDALSLEQKSGVLFAINHFQGLLFAELSDCDLYFISPKRAYQMQKLIFSAEDVLSELSKKMLSQECKNEIQEAGRCIAFDLPTACGFHIFRAVETVVLMYFPAINVPVPTKPGEKNLGKYIDLLEKNGVDANIIGMLKHLKDGYRNPLMHPEISLGDDEAQDLFQFAISAIGTMTKDIEQNAASAGASTAQP